MTPPRLPLEAAGPHPDLGPEDQLFAPFIGSWALDVTWHEGDTVVRRERGVAFRLGARGTGRAGRVDRAPAGRARRPTPPPTSTAPACASPTRRRAAGARPGWGRPSTSCAPSWPGGSGARSCSTATTRPAGTCAGRSPTSPTTPSPGPTPPGPTPPGTAAPGWSPSASSPGVGRAEGERLVAVRLRLRPRRSPRGATVPWRVRRLRPAGRLGQSSAGPGDRRLPRPPAVRRRDAPVLRGQPVRARARERAGARRVPRPGHGVPGQRQLHRVAVLDRRPQAGQRGVGDGGHPVLQLRQGRQEGRAPRVDPGPGVRRLPSRRPAPTGSSPWTCTRRRCRASSRCRSTTSTPCRCCARRSRPRRCPTWSSCRPTPGSPRRPGSTPAASARRSPSPTRSGPTTPRRPRSSTSSATSRGGRRCIVDDFTISAGTLVDAARVLKERGATTVYAAVSHGLLTTRAVERLDGSDIERLFMTDSVETQPVELARAHRGRVGGRPVRRGHPPHRPPRVHQRPLPVAALVPTSHVGPRWAVRVRRRRGP